MLEQIKQTKRDYLNSSSGHFALWMAVIAFPLLVATSAVVDYRKAEANRASIKGALDTAVLTAVANNTITNTQKSDLAKEVFKANYVGTAELELDVVVSDGRVEMDALGAVPTSIAKSVGFEKVDVSERSVAEMIRSNTICVLALAESGDEKLRFLGSTQFISPSCSVQSNSKSAFGVVSDSKTTPVAKSFCSAGGATGSFTPAIRGECRVIDDPYEVRTAPRAGACMPDSIFAPSPPVPRGAGFDSLGNLVSTTGLPPNGHEPGVTIINTDDDEHEHYHCHLGDGKCHVGEHDTDTLHAPTPGLRLQNLGISPGEISRLIADYGPAAFLQTESENYTKSNGLYSPGTYCGGLTVSGENVTFLPGTYIMKDGPLTFKNGAVANGQDVSFVLSGTDSVLTVESGAYVNVKAPRNGELAGLAFYQDVNSDSGTPKTGRDRLSSPMMARSMESAAPAPRDPSPATGVNLISSGGELNVTGTMYFPTQALEVMGDGVLGAKAPATSFIAHQVTFAENSKASVSVDHVKGGIPPMLPRSDDGARLVE